MPPHPRYDIIEKIAAGDFATVFRARDKELARDVAIKQIHPQFLSDPRQLNRYWEEAQILASFEHPNVLTIYDIDRDRGWLILELMSDTMQSRAGGKPLDLELIRMGLVCGLKALEFLHKSNIIHGDVKPSNLLIDRRNWIKLGDFGLAQRAADDQGSLFKGTTRYIAPERVDPEIFGPVGPHSDLYSLGFSMYELLCGNGFESLFPGLNAFGADKQIAWMMWHAGPDRKLPQIDRVLKGVPEDLAHVIERLVAKDPKTRYRDAQEAIRDLKIGMGKGGIGPTEAEKAEAEAVAVEEAKKKRQKKLLIAAVVSMVASVLLLWIFKEPPPPVPVKPLLSIDGQIVQIVPARNTDQTMKAGDTSSAALILGTFVVDTEDKSHQEITIRPFDQVDLNDNSIDINSDQFDLNIFKKEDHVHTAIEKNRSTGKQIQIIHISRPIQDTGIITDVRLKKKAVVFETTREGQGTKRILIRLPEKIAIEVNGKQFLGAEKDAIELLKPQDLVTLRHNVFIDKNNRQEGRVVQSNSTIRVTRKLITKGTVENVDVTQQSIGIRTGKKKTVRLPLKKECDVFLNGRNLVGDRRFALADLQYGDTVTVLHDTHAVRIDAERTNKAKGTITNIIPAARKITVRLQDEGSPSFTFRLPNAVQPLLGDKPVRLAELQPTDIVNLTYDGTDPKNLVISQLSAQRVTDRQRWALVIGFNAYEDSTLSSVNHLGADAGHIRDTLIERYRIPRDQTLLLENVVRAEMKRKVTSFLRRMRAESELLIYFGGHAYLDAYKQPQLAAKDFKRLDTEESGLPLQWLITEIESCKASDKTLFLDTCHEGSGNDLKDQPASEQQILILEDDRTQPALKSVTVIVSCREGQRGQRTNDGGSFARAIASAYRGDADKNNDQHVSLQEADEYIRNRVSKETLGSQITSIVKPGKVVPPRLSKNALDQMKTLAKKLKRRRVTSAELAPEINKLQLDGGTEPEPLLLIALADIRLANWKDALLRFEEIPEHVIAQQGIVWSHYQLRKYQEAINTLISLIHLSGQGLKGNEQQSVEAKRVLEWVGRLREYAATAAPGKDQISQIDAENIDDAAKAVSQQANHYYTKGRHFVADKVEDFDDTMNDATSSASKLTIRNKKTKLKNYVSFNLPLAISLVLQSVENNK